MLADSSHRVSFFIHSFLCVGIPLLIWDWQCVMIMGNNPLTAVHVARDVEIIDREAFIMDLDENPAHPGGMLICFVQCLPTAHFFFVGSSGMVYCGFGLHTVNHDIFPQHHSSRT